MARLAWERISRAAVVSAVLISTRTRADPVGISQNTPAPVPAYAPLDQYSGQSFLDNWDFHAGIDNTTWGNVTYVNRTTGVDQRLAYVNDAGNLILRVDNKSTIQPDILGGVFRSSIWISTRSSYGVGNVIVLDALHLPWGCSVAPSLWTVGIDKAWPAGGEIDIIEGRNDAPFNQMALHTSSGCRQAASVSQTGNTSQADCAAADGRGCAVVETKNSSYGAGFAAANGGVFAVQFDSPGISIWFWSRADVPANIAGTVTTSNNQNNYINTSTWGIPSAAYPASDCDISKFFTSQKINLGISLCGSGGSLFSDACPAKTGNCALDFVAGGGHSSLVNAYFEIRSLRVFSLVPSPGTTTTTQPGMTVTIITTQTQPPPPPTPPPQTNDDDPAPTDTGITLSLSSGTRQAAVPSAPSNTSESQPDVTDSPSAAERFFMDVYIYLLIAMLAIPIEFIGYF